MGFLDSLMGGGKEKTKTTIPSYIQKPSWTIGDKANQYMIQNPTGLSGGERDAYGRITNIANQPNPFGGATNWFQNLISGNGLNQQQNALASALTGGNIINPAFGETQRVAMGGDMGQNPWLNAAYQQAAGQMTDQFNQSVIPGLDTNFASHGRLGSSAYALLRNQQEGQLAKGLGDLGTNIFGGAYATDQANRMNALNQFGQMGQTGIENRLSGAGLYNTGANQLQQGIGQIGNLQGLRYDDANRALAVQNQLSQAPWEQLQRGSAALSGLAGPTTTTKSTSTNPLTQFLGLGGQALGMQMPTNANGSGGGQAGGALMAAMMGSDRRLKTDIEPMPGTLGGAPLYRFRYRTDPVGTVRLGVMADEAPAHAVHVMADGMLAVDYAAL